MINDFFQPFQTFDERHLLIFQIKEFRIRKTGLKHPFVPASNDAHIPGLGVGDRDEIGEKAPDASTTEKYR